MAEVNNEILKIGDIVTLKLNPEFRGVILIFMTSNNQAINGSESGINKNTSGVFANVGCLDEHGKQIYATYSILHLRLVERP